MGEASRVMKIWFSEGHLTDMALERRAAGEAETRELQAIDSHLQTCPECQARQAEWREIFFALARLEPVEPSPAFDDRVMARVRQPAPVAASAPPWWQKLARRLRPVAVGATAAWGGVVAGGAGGAIWLVARVDVSATALFARFFDYSTQLAWAGVVKIAAFLELSGLADAWTTAAGVVPGPGVLSAVALMTAVSGLAVWTLYRVTGHQPSGMNAHV